MLRIGILGATGYTAVELIKILLRHPQVEIGVVTSRQEGAPTIASIHPQLTGRLDLRVEDLAPLDVAARCDCVFSCLPHAASAQAIAPMLSTDVRVVDLSADYRLRDPRVYAEWYGDHHPDNGRLGKVVYGLPEFYAAEIAQSQLVANPGCYPTSAILALAPLVRGGLVRPEGIIVDSKSGVSGAGRTPKLNTLFPECNESVAAYNVGHHRHTPEIDQGISMISGKDVQVVFTPHLIPMDRGILTTTYSVPTAGVTETQLMDTLRATYASAPFVRVVDHLPATKDCSGTNFCHLTARIVRGRVVTVSVLDNLIKGASGAAVQNMNRMFGYGETLGFY